MQLPSINPAMAALRYLAELSRWKKQLLVFAVDLIALFSSIWIAYSLRISEWVLWNEPIQLYAIGSVAAMIAIFVATGVYRAIFRYAGVGMMKTLIRAFIPYGAAMVAVYMLWGVPPVPRTMAIMQPICFFLLVLGIRGIARYLMLDVLGRGRYKGEVRRVLIYGAGAAGQQLAASIRSEPEMRLVGFIDDDVRLNKQKLDGARVYWSGELPKVIKESEVTDILLAMPGASRKRRRQIVGELDRFQVNVKTLPQMKQLVGGSLTVSDIRPLDIEDLLGREPVAANELLLGRTIVGRTVLVTGAGGSIGSELCRQIVEIGAEHIVLLEVSEFALYSIDKALRAARDRKRRVNQKITPLLGSVSDAKRVEEIFSTYSIDTVYHAAAYKHVPLVEANPHEGIRNNILGTARVAEAADRHGASNFILVSTDKAVRPTNVMGATKRAAEQIVQAFADRSTKTNFSMVRFGNVLGSSGSVVPLFRGQIEAGGPITLTDKRITRYFMTIPEAASLVIQAGGMARGGEVFVLDMGQPQLIADLARTMVRLSGLSVRDKDNPDGEIEIKEIGLRPGEKLYEELLIGDRPEETVHPRILKSHEDFLELAKLTELIAALESAKTNNETIDLLKRLVPEFEHQRDNDNRQLAQEQ